ncbi:pheromone-regulated protein PRM7-like isoform X3 [Varroa destructor]|nr:pheromone-regulated protein PRM7-like isoform X3 [Varroa destructor]
MISHGATTIHETKVIGTYIQGKYAQILESTSRVIQPSAVGVSPSPTFASQGHSTAPPGLQTIERRGDVGDLEKLLLQASFKSSSATLQSRQIQQTTRLEPKFTETIEDDNKIHFTRRPNGRSQSSTTSRLRYSPLAKSHSVRLNRFKVRLTSRYEDQTALPSEVEHLNAFDSQVKALDLDDPLLNIDPARITWLPTTFTSLVTLRAGQRKSVIRTLTITTSFPTTIEPSEVLSNGISDNAIDPTPSGLVHSRIYSTEQHTWRTSLIPASHDGLTSMQTITESFVIRKFVTAYRTMPSSEITDEMTNETLSFLDESDDSYIKTLLAGDINATATTKTDEPLTSKNILDELQNALQKNPLAALLLGLNTQLQPSLQTVTRSSTYVTTDTLYHTKVVSFYDGRRTRSKRLSDSIGTTERTLTTVTTEVITIQPTQAFPFPFLLQPTPTASYSTITSLYTTVTTGTSYASKIFTLIYNAFSTRYRTVTSSSTYPTTMVITSTSSFLVQPTLAYGGYPSQTSPGYQAQVPQQAQLVHQLSQAVVAEPQPLATVQGNAPQPTPVTTNLPMAMVTKATVFEPVSSAPAILAAGLSSSESVESSIPSADLTSGADEASAVSSSEQVATPVLAIAANLAPAAPPAQAAASSALQPNLTA